MGSLPHPTPALILVGFLLVSKAYLEGSGLPGVKQRQAILEDATRVLAEARALRDTLEHGLMREPVRFDRIEHIPVSAVTFSRFDRF